RPRRRSRHPACSSLRSRPAGCCERAAHRRASRRARRQPSIRASGRSCRAKSRASCGAARPPLGTLMRVATGTPEHPNLPRRGALGLMFVGIALSGMLGGLIGYGLVKTSCAGTSTRAERLLAVVPNFHAQVASCTLPEFLAAFVGTVFAALGAG